MDRKLLTIEEAAKVLGIGRSSMFTHILPELQTVWIGRKRLVPPAELDRWIAEHRTAGSRG